MELLHQKITPKQILDEEEVQHGSFCLRLTSPATQNRPIYVDSIIMLYTYHTFVLVLKTSHT